MFLFDVLSDVSDVCLKLIKIFLINEEIVADDKTEGTHTCTKIRNCKPPSSLQQIPKLGKALFFFLRP